MHIVNRMFHMFYMAVWDNEGRMYLPVWGYDDQISHYAQAREAIAIHNQLVEEEEAQS